MTAKNISRFREVFGDGTNLIINSSIERHPGEQGQGVNAGDYGLSHFPRHAVEARCNEAQTLA